MMPPSPEWLEPVLVRLALAASLGAVAGASLTSALRRGRERRRRARDARADAPGVSGGGVAAEREATAGGPVRGGRDAERTGAGVGKDTERAVRLVARARANERIWNRRRETLEARERASRHRIETLLAEQQAAEERHSRLDAELRALRAERDIDARAPRPVRAYRESAGRGGPGSRPEGVPVLNRRVDARARGAGPESLADYPMLAESELPERADSLQLEDLLD